MTQYKHNSSDVLSIYGIIKDPPCALANYVQFVSCTCPHSGEVDCSECITNEFDAECVNWLKSARKFGYT